MTKSLCPICFKPLDAEVFDEDGKILIKKTCDEHGEFGVMISFIIGLNNLNLQ